MVSCGSIIYPVLDEDDEQSKKMTSEAADVALQMSFKVRKFDVPKVLWIV